MKRDRYRVKLYRHPNVKAGVWGAFPVLRSGRVSSTPIIMSTRGPGSVMDAICRLDRKRAKVMRRPTTSHFGDRQIVPRGFDH